MTREEVIRRDVRSLVAAFKQASGLTPSPLHRHLSEEDRAEIAARQQDAANRHDPRPDGTDQVRKALPTWEIELEPLRALCPSCIEIREGSQRARPGGA